MQRRIAFISVYPNMPVTRSVQQMLSQAFPEFQVTPFSVTQALKKRPDILAINSLAALVEKGPAILGSKSRSRKAFLGTPYLFRQARRLISKKITPGDYAFSFQLQSLFDLSTPGLPHFVYTDHTHLENLHYSDFDRTTLHSSRWLDLEKQIYHNARHIFTRSSNISASLVEQYGVEAGKVSCVYAGVNVEPGSNGDLPRRYAGKNILFVGVDWERKGGPDLGRAFQRLLKRHPDATLTIVGCRPAIDLPNTRVYGYLPPQALKKYYQEASLFCLPTRLEPFGVVFVEAMSYGLPILATTVGAIPDFVRPGQNGYLVAPGDVEGLAARLEDMIAAPDLLQEFGRRSRDLVKENYNWQSVGGKIRLRIGAALDGSLSSLESAQN